MIKENGRHKKNINKTYAKKEGRKLECMRCKAIIYTKNIEFGEKYMCPDCGAWLVDKEYI